MEVKEGDIIRIKKSKRDGKPIAYDRNGKVILLRNRDKLRYGYGKVTSIYEKTAYYTATAENCICDFYMGGTDEETISVEEFEQVLSMKGFTKEYEELIENSSVFDTSTDDDVFQVWANLETGAMVIFATRYTEENHHNYYDKVEVIIPVSGFDYTGVHSSLGLYNHTNSVEYYSLNDFAEFPLKKILLRSNNSRDWGGAAPSLYHYKDFKDTSKPKISIFRDTILRIRKFNDDVENLFNININNVITMYDELKSITGTYDFIG